MTNSYVLLFFLVVAVWTRLHFRREPVNEQLRLEEDILSDAERSFHSGMTPWRRARLRLLSHSFLSQGERRRLGEVHRVRDESRLFPLPVVEARRFSRGVRDICAFKLSDGRQLELSIYDRKVADAMVGAWRKHQGSAIRLAWHGQLGWCCTLHQLGSSHDAPQARALAWGAEVTTG